MSNDNLRECQECERVRRALGCEDHDPVDMIERDEQEYREALERISELEGAVETLTRMGERAEARVARLRSALVEIANDVPWNGPIEMLQDCQRGARCALEEEDDVE